MVASSKCKYVVGDHVWTAFYHSGSSVRGYNGRRSHKGTVKSLNMKKCQAIVKYVGDLEPIKVSFAILNNSDLSVPFEKPPAAKRKKQKQKPDTSSSDSDSD